jgi:hypothetical protein
MILKQCLVIGSRKKRSMPKVPRDEDPETDFDYEEFERKKEEEELLALLSRFISLVCLHIFHLSLVFAIQATPVSYAMHLMCSFVFLFKKPCRLKMCLLWIVDQGQEEKWHMR